MVQKRPMVGFLIQRLLASVVVRAASRVETENLILRQQLVYYGRKSSKRLRLWNIDRCFSFGRIVCTRRSWTRSYRPAGDRDPLHPTRFSAPTGAEVPPRRRPSTDCCRDSGADPVDEPRVWHLESVNPKAFAVEARNHVLVRSDQDPIQ